MPINKESKDALKQFYSIMCSEGWSKDSYGHLKKTVETKDRNNETYRYHVGKRVIRYEVQVVVDYGSGSTNKSWTRIRSIPIKDLPKILGLMGAIIKKES